VAHKHPYCPSEWDHPRDERPKVLALGISDRPRARRIGGYQMSARMVHGVDVHCPYCHCEGWVEIVDGWRLDQWDGPKRCSCGETAR
jgi:hypothetical protein